MAPTTRRVLSVLLPTLAGAVLVCPMHAATPDRAPDRASDSSPAAGQAGVEGVVRAASRPTLTVLETGKPQSPDAPPLTLATLDLAQPAQKVRLTISDLTRETDQSVSVWPVVQDRQLEAVVSVALAQATDASHPAGTLDVTFTVATLTGTVRANSEVSESFDESSVALAAPAVLRAVWHNGWLSQPQPVAARAEDAANLTEELALAAVGFALSEVAAPRPSHPVHPGARWTCDLSAEAFGIPFQAVRTAELRSVARDQPDSNPAISLQLGVNGFWTGLDPRGPTVPTAANLLNQEARTSGSVEGTWEQGRLLPLRASVLRELVHVAEFSLADSGTQATRRRILRVQVAPADHGVPSSSASEPSAAPAPAP